MRYLVFLTQTGFFMPSRRPARRSPAFASGLGPLLVLAVCAAVAGCAAAVTPSLVQPPPSAPAALIVGELVAADPRARRLARIVRAAMIDRLVRAEAFAVIYDRAPGELAEGALVLDGEVTEADRGSDAWRFVLGAGFGRPRFAAAFTVADAAGDARVSFTAASDEDGPGGLTGHWEPLSMEGLAADLGVEAADAVVRWARGDGVPEPLAFRWP